jgi:hypothetical protein
MKFDYYYHPTLFLACFYRPLRCSSKKIDCCPPHFVVGLVSCFSSALRFAPGIDCFTAAALFWPCFLTHAFFAAGIVMMTRNDTRASNDPLAKVFVAFCKLQISSEMMSFEILPSFSHSCFFAMGGDKNLEQL